MFRKAGRFTVLPFGYERTLPEVAQHVEMVKFKPVLEDIRNAPDFILISHDRTEVFIVEVKYRKTPNWQEMEDIARNMKDRWTAIWLFVATPEQFYFDSCTNIIKNGGAVKELGDWVSQDIQKEMRDLMNEFIR